MARLGRNPFQKVEIKVPHEKVEVVPQPKPLTFPEKIVRFLSVDFPAEGILLTLKAALLVRSVWD